MTYYQVRKTWMSRQLWSCTSESASSEARKRGSGGGSPRKYDDLLTGPSDLVFIQNSDGALPISGPRRVRHASPRDLCLVS